MAHIIIEIDMDNPGVFKIEGMGFEGDACLNNIEKLKMSLHGYTINEERKDGQVRRVSQQRING